MDRNDLPQAFRTIWAHVLKANAITLVTHVNPDGDTLGSALALKHLILDNTSGKVVKIVAHQPPRFLSFLNEAEVVSDEFFARSLVIVVDTSTRKRFADQRVNPQVSIKIDHHHEELTWLASIGGDHWPATGEVVYEMARYLNLVMSERVKEALYVAIWTDTDGMLNRNISPRTHQIMAELGLSATQVAARLALTAKEAEAITKLVEQRCVVGNVTYVLADEIVPNDFARQFTALLLAKAPTEVVLSAVWAGDGEVRVSLRSKGNYDVSPLAAFFGGGGHFSSAGIRTKTMAHAAAILEHVLKTVNGTNTAT